MLFLVTWGRKFNVQVAACSNGFHPFENLLYRSQDIFTRSVTEISKALIKRLMWVLCSTNLNWSHSIRILKHWSVVIFIGKVHLLKYFIVKNVQFFGHICHDLKILGWNAKYFFTPSFPHPCLFFLAQMDLSSLLLWAPLVLYD